MKTWLKILLITLGTAVLTFVLSPIIWPPDPHGAAPSGLQLLLFMVLAALDALIFGLGVAFISYGLPLVRRVANGSRARTWITFIATGYMRTTRSRLWCAICGRCRPKRITRVSERVVPRADQHTLQATEQLFCY